MIYFLMILYTIIAAFLFEHSKSYIYAKRNNLKFKRYRNYFTINKAFVEVILGNIIVFLPAVLIIAFRYRFASDYYGTYKHCFEYVLYGGGYSSGEIIEPGYKLLNKLTILFTDKYYWCMFISGIITYIILSYGIYKNSECYSLSILFMFISNIYFDSSNLVRQLIAFAILSVAMNYIKKERFISYFICILIASLFHTSTWIMLPLYFLHKFRIKKWLLLLLILSPIVLSKLYINIAENITVYIGRYNLYQNLIEDNNGNLDLGNFILFIVALICSVFWEKENINSKMANFYHNIIVMGVITSCLSYYIPLASRVTVYFKLSLIFYLPELINKISDKNIRFLVNTSVISIYTGYFIYSVFIANWYEAIPYKTFLFL